MGFRRTLAIGSLCGLLFSSTVSAETPLRFPLTSTADQDTVYDETKAARARKVAEYVITKDNQQGLVSYDSDRVEENANFQIRNVRVVINIDDWKYTIDAFAFYDKDAPLEKSSLINIWMRPKGTNGQDTLQTFSDHGLDGRCDFGIIPKKLSGNQQEISYFAAGDVSKKGENPQYRERFQKLYNETVDKLLAFYERK